MERGISPRDCLCLWKPCIYEWLTRYLAVPSGLIYTCSWLTRDSFAMKMHKQLCHGERRDLAWCSGLKGILSSWQGSGFSFKWFLEADRTSYECGLTFSSSWTKAWHKPDYSWCSLDVIKPSVVGKNVPVHDILILIVRPLPQELIYPYLWSLWIWWHSFPRVFWESRCLRFGLTTPHYHVGQKGFRALESMWSGPSPQAAVVALCLPWTSE